MNQKRFVFLAGLHRSGTSLLHELLRAHPRVSGFRDTGVPEDEGQHLQSVFPPAKAFGGAGQFGFDPRSFMDESDPLVSSENARRLYEEWSRHWDLARDVLIEKSPPNLVRTRFLQALFPGSTFVVILRHPLAVAYATRKWSHTPIPSLLDHSLTCYERFLEDMPHLRRAYVLRYEEFVMRPHETLGDLAPFLGLSEVALGSKPIDPSINDKYFAMWEDDTRALLSGFSLRRAAARWERRARVFGYSLARPRELMATGLLGPHGASQPMAMSAR